MTQSVITVPASKLTIAPTNVRKTSDPAADAQLKASIAARGILQNLIGLPVSRRKGEYRITAGGRRLTQVQALIAEGVLDVDYPVPVLVLAEKGDAKEVSLVENFTRLNMSPAEECRAFQDIIASEKKTPADIARRFGLTERFVLGRLRLASLAEPIFEALADGRISLDIAKAYASICDADRQAMIFAEMGTGYYSTNVAEIRRRLATGFHRGSDPKALLVGRDAYLAAGGRIDNDLFSDSASENWIDADILERLAEECMTVAAEALRGREGFGEVRAICETRIPYMETISLEPVEGEPVALTQEQEDRQRAIEVELEGLAENAEEDGYSDEEAIQVQALEAEYARLTEPAPIIAAEQKATALAYLVIGHDGQPRLHEQLYAIPTPTQLEDEDEVTAEDHDLVNEFEGGDAAAGRSPISQRLADEMAVMKTELLRVHVATDPQFALDLGTFFMVDAAQGYRFDLPSDLRASAPSSRVSGFESGTAAALQWEELEASLDRSWTQQDTISDRYDAFCDLTNEARAAWLGWAIARTLHAVPVGQGGSAMLDHLGRKLGIDVAAWWRPTARTYFDRVSKPTILAHFEEIGGAELKSRYGASKKHDLALSAEKLFGGQIIVEAEVRDKAIAWLPDAMRFALPALSEELRTEMNSADAIAQSDDETGTADEIAQDGDLSQPA